MLKCATSPLRNTRVSGPGDHDAGGQPDARQLPAPCVGLALQHQSQPGSSFVGEVRRRHSPAPAVLPADLGQLLLQPFGRDAAHGAEPALPPVERLETPAHRLVGGALEIEVDRRLDRQARAVQARGAERVHQLAADLLDEAGGEVRRAREGRVAADARGTREGLAVRLRRDEPALQHLAQHIAPACLGLFWVTHGRVGRRPLWQSSQQRGLREIELRHLLAEVGSGRIADAVRAVPQIGVVQVDQQDLVLAETALHLEGQQHLPELAAPGALGREQHVLHHLLGDGARSLFDAAAAQVRPGGAQDGRDVEAGVLEEVCVLAGHEGLDHVLRDVVQSHQPAALHEELADHPSVSVGDHADQRGAIVEQRLQRLAAHAAARRIQSGAEGDRGNGEGHEDRSR